MSALQAFSTFGDIFLSIISVSKHKFIAQSFTRQNTHFFEVFADRFSSRPHSNSYTLTARLTAQRLLYFLSLGLYMHVGDPPLPRRSDIPAARSPPPHLTTPASDHDHFNYDDYKVI